MAPRVLISDDLSPAAVQIFRDRGVDVDFQPKLGRDKAHDVLYAICEEHKRPEYAAPPLLKRMVAAGHWKDYAMGFERDVATFAAYRRAAERPEFTIEKRPALRNRQGEGALIGEHGAVLKRGHELGPVLAPVERRLMKLVAD